MTGTPNQPPEPIPGWAEERVDISADVLRELLRCEPEAGRLFWRQREQRWFPNLRMCRVWNAQHAGKEAFTGTHTGGYRSGRVLNQPFTAHRVIWTIVHGEWPDQIDHINGDKTDNRLSNLRSVSNDENRKNMAMPRNNKSGVIGVHWDPRRNKWAAHIGARKNERFLGRFADFNEAVAARQNAEREEGYHPNHGRKGSAVNV